MKINTFIAEFRAENESYDASGLIDDASLYKWIIDAMKPFGQNIMTLQDTVVDVRGKEGFLPRHFHTLYIAYKCDNKGYNVDPKYIDTLQQSYMWTERIKRGFKWNSCEPYCKEDTEEIITEKVYFREIDDTVDFYYNYPVMLKLGKTMKRNKCHEKCRNLIVRDCPYEIIINETTLYTNFKEGNVYMQYYGLPLDDDGKLILPEVGNGELLKYIDYYVHLKFYEKLLKNKDDENIITLFNYYIRKEESQKGLALTDTKFSKLTPESFRRLKKKNRADMRKFTCSPAMQIW